MVQPLENIIVRHRDDFTEVINDYNLKSVVEVGVHMGVYAEHLVSKCPHITYYGVDAWTCVGMSTSSKVRCENRIGVEEYDGDKVKQFVQDKLDAALDSWGEDWHGGEPVLIRENTPKASLQFKDNSIDFVYIDAGHTFADVKADIDAWLKIVKPGGILAGHDYTSKRYRGVKKAVKLRFPEDEIRVTETDRPKSWWIIKNEES